MNLQTVITNLKRTIEGKEALLEEYKKASLIAVRNDAPDRVTIGAMAGFLSVNIEELNRILDDLVECSVQGINLSWQQNPDRSGGQFTEDEINSTNQWR